MSGGNRYLLVPVVLAATLSVACGTLTVPQEQELGEEFAREIRTISKPTTLLVSRDGEVVHVRSGAFTSYDDLREVLRTYLKVDLP